VRYAVVGLGWIAQDAILPAFRGARGNSELHALVSDDPVKLRTLGRQYGVERRFGYDDYERCLEDVDAVFIALPNTLHRDFAVRAARKGVHVLCEKPMAVTPGDARSIARACARARVKLMVAYRLHFEAATLEALRLVRAGRIGRPRVFTAAFGMAAEAGNLRLRRGEGGPLYDIGIYCVNAARHLFGAEPREVTGAHFRGGDRRFRDAPEATSALLRFRGDRLAAFTCSFGLEKASTYEVYGTEGSIRMEPGFSHADALTLHVTRGERTRKRTYPARDQFAAELVYFSDCVRKDRAPEPSGEEGLADVRVLAAIDRSAARRRPVRLPAFGRRLRPSKRQAIRRPLRAKPRLVRADDPRQD
jgi:glucose-fructose oxidoreductase